MLFCCTGVGIFNRGIESFFREAFDGLRSLPGLEARLVKGRELDAEGTPPDETKVWCLPRTGRVSSVVGRVTGRSAYAVEQWSSFPGVLREIREFHPDVLFSSEANLGFVFHRLRPLLPSAPRFLFSNGGPCGPPFDRFDHVHQVAPYYLTEAIEAGERPAKHSLAPYGIHVPQSPPVCDAGHKKALRKCLGLPPDRSMILSVGWIARQHKRMHYVIEEVARLPEPRPFLQLLGNIDENSQEIIELGNRLLGKANFSARSVHYDEVAEYYHAADIFALGSLKEGFGRVYLEALMHGLPTIGHRHPVIEYVLGENGIVADLERPGELAHQIRLQIGRDEGQVEAERRWREVARRFSWDALGAEYLRMFQRAAINHP